MNADADIQVWLEQVAKPQPAVIVPWVKSSADRILHYQVRTVKVDSSGTSDMRGAGVVHVIAGVPAPLGRMSVSRTGESECHVDLILSEPGLPARAYHFACPG